MDLPDKILAYTLSFIIEIKDILSCLKVCHQFRIVIRDITAYIESQ